MSGVWRSAWDYALELRVRAIDVERAAGDQGEDPQTPSSRTAGVSTSNRAHYLEDSLT